mgnify:FL=1
MKRSTKIITATAVIALGVAAIVGTGIAGSRWGGQHQGYGQHAGYEMGMKGGMHGGRHGGGPRMMERFDADGDGKVTAEEVASVRTKAMNDYDADKDGALTLNEFKGLWDEHMQGRQVRGFQHFDADGDGKITVDELKAPTERMFSRMDRNDDGVISDDDMQRKGWGWRHHDNDDDDRPRGPKNRAN